MYYFVLSIAVYFLTDVNCRPLRFAARLILLILGFYWVKTKGKLASREEAPLLICNHITLVDAFYFGYECMPMFVAKAEVKRMPLLGTIAEALQCIFVDREKEQSRGNVLQTIKKRSSEPNWPQIFIFPGSFVITTFARVLFQKEHVPMVKRCCPSSKEHLYLAFQFKALQSSTPTNTLTGVGFLLDNQPHSLHSGVFASLQILWRSNTPRSVYFSSDSRKFSLLPGSCPKRRRKERPNFIRSERSKQLCHCAQCSSQQSCV